MNEQNDILERVQQGGNPFRMPEGYLDTFDDRLMARISSEAAQEPSQRRIWVMLKPALALAATFALIFGMGYGVLSLTHTIDRGTGTNAAEFATVAEEFIRPASLINYYQTDEMTAEEEEIDEEEIISYLSSQLSYYDLADIYAQSNLK